MEESAKEDEQFKNGQAQHDETEKEEPEEKMEVLESQEDNQDDVEKPTETVSEQVLCLFIIQKHLGSI